MSDYITTFTGIRMDPCAPKKEDIAIEDIAHSLPLICRGNGHVKTFFSVGQHCIFCAEEAAARGYGARVKLACLLHDACECYMSDVPRPFKKSLPEYTAHETAFLDLIYAKFLGETLTAEEAALVDEIDDSFLWYDLTYLMSEGAHGEAPKLLRKPDYTLLPFEEVQKRYLELFSKFRAEL